MSNTSFAEIIDATLFCWKPWTPCRACACRSIVTSSGHLQAYYRETRTVRYVATDGTSVVCCAIADVEPDMASKIVAEMDAVTDVSPEALVAAAERALGTSAVRVQ